MTNIRTFAALIITMLVFGCNSSPKTPQPSPQSAKLHDALEAERTLSQTHADTEGVTHARQAATSFIHTHLSDWKIEGMLTDSSSSNGFMVAADLSRLSQGKHTASRQTLYVMVRQFIREDGTCYWKTEKYSRGLTSAPEFTTDDFPATSDTSANSTSSSDPGD